MYISRGCVCVCVCVCGGGGGGVGNIKLNGHSEAAKKKNVFLWDGCGGI